jgi:hypothetical protein
MPPGQLSPATCVECRTSTLNAVIDTGNWPHDLMHQLGTALDGAAVTITESVEIDTDPRIREKFDAHMSECSRPMIDCVRDYVAKQIRTHTVDLLDVLDECVTPRLDDWISSQAISLTPHLRG